MRWRPILPAEPTREISTKLMQFRGRYFAGSSTVRCATCRTKRLWSCSTHCQPSWHTIRLRATFQQLGGALAVCMAEIVESALTSKFSTASSFNDGAGAVDCNSRRAVGPIRTIRGVYMTQLLLARNEWSFYIDYTYCARRYNSRASDRANIYPIYPVG